ncbi:Imidazoleglycerol-phosphate dehydratase [Desulfarculus baarsii DSM 2075]|uniref:Imidazoleglycerol-phosphate dehydratase n=1 Tax=Desulfarculus baarsii (strain ATCC 33931 / DSM 2075 / LMG 7858 / VKM B-1802 / 2st14) TaxID=644282 RepID=E1QGV1_DESB2|nr:imidazoleglycerol-phosphate dehydratase HisB [Desulfarculus baarsii]ADK84794.1 Imidazoleglycerol-phosphate dehydratase [Desulfarculus baarsii DSM 2075]
MGRTATIKRETRETAISLRLDLDGRGEARIDTGVGFFDHMLTHIAFHGRFDLEVTAKGDLHVDAHHTVEDVGICLGQALRQALGDKLGVARYGGAFVPMDEALAQVVVDLSNRPFMRLEAARLPGAVGAFDGQLAEEFLRALANAAGLTLHVILHYGSNDHHMLEAAFKALGRALDQATAMDPRQGGVASTKGML